MIVTSLIAEGWCLAMTILSEIPMWIITTAIVTTVIILLGVFLTEKKPDMKEYDQCHGCPNGFCMLTPGSEECKRELEEVKKWRGEIDE